MARPGFAKRAAHLSYVAPLVAVLLFLQLRGRMESSPTALAFGLSLLALLLAGGVMGSILALRIASREGQDDTRAPAVLGLVASVAAGIAGVVWIVALR